VYLVLGEILDVLADLDSEESDRDTLRVEGERQLRDHVAEWAAALIQEREAERAEALDDDKSPHEASLQTTMPKTGCIQAAKACLQVQPEVITTLWNELTHAYEDDPRNIAERFNASALARQHRDRGDAQYGERFLNQWPCSLRQCRTNLTEVEMANILLSIQRHKRPGPNGIQAICGNIPGGFRGTARAGCSYSREFWGAHLESDPQDPRSESFVADERPRDAK